MSIARKDEARLLAKDELELVEKTHHPAIAELSDKELAETKKLLRERRDRAGDIAKRQRREMRGKAGRAQGAKPASDNLGTKEKSAALGQALKRLNSETARRQSRSGREATQAGMKKALEMKSASASAKRPASKTADKGMAKNESGKRATKVNPGKVGSVSAAGKKSQAKRDG
ncbi:hypothetical protein FKB34_04215 [Glycocaulis profundi]|nr:hypothetical protein FKB34_04215 [Glycocaulis profundi]